MDIAIIFLALACVANISLGLFVLLRNPNSKPSRAFLATTVLITAWAVSNYLTDSASSLSFNSFFNRLAYLFAFLAILSAAAFSSYFSGNAKKRSSASLLLASISIVVFCLFSISTYVAGTVEKINGQLMFNQGSLAYVYDLVIFLILVIIIRNMYGLMRRGNSLQKSQANIIIIGFSVCILLALLSNAILPLITDNFKSAKYGPPLLSFLLVSSVSYAIVRHKLFDIRSFVVRAAVYFLTISVASLLYILPVLLLTNVVLDEKLQPGTLLVMATVTLITALLFQPLRNYFNRITNRLFFRDFYEPQEVLDRLTNLLVGSAEREKITQQSSQIIKRALKLQFVRYSLVVDRNPAEHDLLVGLLKSKPDIIDLEQLLNSGSSSELSDSMNKNDIALAVRLKTTSKDLGFMLLGYKESGAPYNQADKKILGIMADAIAVSLQNALRFEEIQHFNITLQEKVEEATRELRKVNTKLRELDKTKDEFISMASHQLRTPLTTVKGYLSMLLEGDIGSVKKEQKEILQNAFDGSNRMVYLIADLLNVSRLQSGKFVIDNKPTDLPEVVQGEVEQLRAQALTRQVELNYKRPEHFPALALDETKIRQVIMNFLDNALYYTPKGGKVEVVLAATDSMVSYTVTDTGLGVPKEVQHHLFTKFYRADNARKMRPDGTGLGLFMAKKVVVAQGGAIIFKSTEGKGSTFGFSFPRRSTEIKGAKP